MCGIFGYLGTEDPLKVCISGLELLEYRGYDSSGIAGIRNGAMFSFKKAGKLANLKQELKTENLSPIDLIIGHTRWATHGKVNDLNAHPHFDMHQEIAIVHNGIIENYLPLREKLVNEGVVFSSETDSEVIVQCIAKLYEGNLTLAVQKTVALLKGIYALAIIHKNHPKQIVAAASECPLAIGIDDEQTESYLSSDPSAFGKSGLNVLFLQNGEIASIERGKVEVLSSKDGLVKKKTERIEINVSAPSKEGFDHFLLKEIFEQPTTIMKALFGRFHEGTVLFENFHLSPTLLKKIQNVWILGCGTSAHAGSIAAIYLEEIAKLSAFSEIASEARYRTPLLTPETLVVAISQSGETADTIAALREAKAAGCTTLGICNVAHSTLARETDQSIFLKAGPEISVCSSKALTSQIAVLFLFSLYMAGVRGLNESSRLHYFQELKKIPAHVQKVLDSASLLEKLAVKYASFNDFFFIGRRHMFTTCLEAALKLKEISYVNANGYPAGELKHGAIALIDSRLPVVAFCANLQTKDKIISNLMEVKARGAPILAFAPEGMKEVADVADDVFWLPATIDELAPFSSTVAGQLLAYYIAKARGCDIDQPRNLAKSVTVE